MLGIFMAMRYWPFSTAAAVSERPARFAGGHDDLGINDVDDAHGGVAQGDGNADEQDLLNDLPAGGGNVQRFLPVPVGDEIGAQEQHGYRCARRDTHDGPRRAELSGFADVEHVPR